MQLRAGRPLVLDPSAVASVLSPPRRACPPELAAVNLNDRWCASHTKRIQTGLWSAGVALAHDVRPSIRVRTKTSQRARECRRSSPTHQPGEGSQPRPQPLLLVCIRIPAPITDPGAAPKRIRHSLACCGLPTAPRRETHDAPRSRREILIKCGRSVPRDAILPARGAASCDAQIVSIELIFTFQFLYYPVDPSPWTTAMASPSLEIRHAPLDDPLVCCVQRERDSKCADPRVPSSIQTGITSIGSAPQAREKPDRMRSAIGIATLCTCRAVHPPSVCAALSPGSGRIGIPGDQVDHQGEPVTRHDCSQADLGGVRALLDVSKTSPD